MGERDPLASELLKIEYGQLFEDRRSLQERVSRSMKLLSVVAAGCVGFVFYEPGAGMLEALASTKAVATCAFLLLVSIWFLGGAAASLVEFQRNGDRIAAIESGAGLEFPRRLSGAGVLGFEMLFASSTASISAIGLVAGVVMRAGGSGSWLSTAPGWALLLGGVAVFLVMTGTLLTLAKRLHGSLQRSAAAR